LILIDCLTFNDIQLISQKFSFITSRESIVSILFHLCTLQLACDIGPVQVQYSKECYVSLFAKLYQESV